MFDQWVGSTGNVSFARSNKNRKSTFFANSMSTVVLSLFNCMKQAERQILCGFTQATVGNSVTNFYNSQLKFWAATVTIMWAWLSNLKIPQTFRYNVFIWNAFFRKLCLCFINKLKRMGWVTLFALEFLNRKKFIGFAACDELGSCFQALRSMALAWENNWKRVISFTLDALFNGSIVLVMNAMILDEIWFHTNFV